MAAPSGKDENKNRQAYALDAPEAGINSSKPKNSGKSTQAAIFVGLFDCYSHQYALFVNSCPNTERQLTIAREQYFQAFGNPSRLLHWRQQVARWSPTLVIILSLFDDRGVPIIA